MSRRDAASASRHTEEARLAAAQCSGEGLAVRHLHSIFVPEDETCFYLYEAASAAAVCEAARRAGMRFERISEAASQPSGEETSDEHARG